jgi:hypothetical protein
MAGQVKAAAITTNSKSLSHRRRRGERFLYERIWVGAVVAVSVDASSVIL